MSGIQNTFKTFLKWCLPLFILWANNPFYSFSKNTFPFLENDTITVIDGKTHEALIGASVSNTTTNQKTITNEKGQAILKDPAQEDVIEIAYLGYQTKQISFLKLRDKKHGIVKLFEAALKLETAVVVGRKDQNEAEIPSVVQRISKENIAFSNAQTGADVLRDNANVYVQKTQLGGGSPIIRGFEANRVLLVMDGIRMNNAVYRSGHLQNSITLDNSILEQIEVIYGPGSLMYGSDALGGVVHYRTRDPKLVYDGKKRQMNSSAYMRFSSANREKTFHADVDFGGRRWASLSSFTYSDFGDLVAGSKRPDDYPNFGKQKFYAFRNGDTDEVRISDVNEQTGTGYNQIDFLQKIKYQPKDHLSLVLNLQYSTSGDIPRYDNLSDTLAAANELKWAEWHYGPQQRLLTSLKMQSFKPTSLFDKTTVIVAFQKIDEDLFKRKFGETDKTFQFNDIYVYSITGDFDKYLDEKRRNTFSYGFEVNYNKVSAVAGNENIEIGGVKNNELTRYPSGGNDQQNFASYLSYLWKSRDSTLHFNGGVRFTNTKTDINYLRSDAALIEWSETYYAGISNQNSALTYGAGLTWNTKKNWQIKSVVSSAFRAPNLDDLAKIRPKNGFITIPNLDLKPERSMNYEITIAKQFGAVVKNHGAMFKLSGTGFYTALTDAIVRELGELPGGDSTLIVEGKPHTLHQNKNTGEATIYGFSGNFLFNFKNRILIKSSINFTKGRRKYFEEKNGIVIDTLVPLDHIPPLYGQTSVTFQRRKFKLEAVLRYNGAKPVEEYAVNYIDHDPACGLAINREGMADNIEAGLIDKNPAACASIFAGLPSWITYNIYGSYQINERFSVNLALENITDIHYRGFASTISAPGRNFILALRGSF